jgi:aspartate beta-hydroxylase
VVKELENNYEEIKSEYMQAVMGISNGDKAVNTKLLEGDYDVGGASGGEHDGLHKGTWDWHSYVQKGVVKEGFREVCPKTAEIVEGMGDKMFTTPFAFAFFSTLGPGSRIEPHTSAMNLRLR